MIKQKLKKPHNIFFLLCVLFIMFSCNRKQERKIISVQELITDSLLLPVSDLVISKGGINHIPDNDSLISFFDKNSFNIYLYDIKNNSFIDTLSVWKYKDIIVDYELKTKDTLYALLDINHIVKIATDFEKIYDLNYLLQKEVDSFVFTGRISSKFKIFGDTAVVELCTRRKRSDWNGPNKEHLMSNFDIGVKLEDVPKMIYKHNPNSKDLLVQDYYTFRRRVSISKNEAFYSYSHSNELLHTTFQPFQIDTIKIDTNFFFENIPLDYQQTSDFGYITRYTMSQSRFGLIFYDVFRKKVVLFMKHKGEYVEKDGTKNEYGDLPRSMFIIDKETKEQKEIYIPDKFLGSYYLSFFTPNGFYIPANKSKQNDKKSVLFYKINIAD